jgi:hypothetical protein
VRRQRHNRFLGKVETPEQSDASGSETSVPRQSSPNVVGRRPSGSRRAGASNRCRFASCMERDQQGISGRPRLHHRIPWPPARLASAARCLGGASSIRSGSSRPARVHIDGSIKPANPFFFFFLVFMAFYLGKKKV